jgi:hypothetical protein
VSAVAQNPKGPDFAVVFTRDCGATTGWATHVSVVPRPSVGDATTGNVFVADGGSPQDPGVAIAWTSVRTLSVSYSRNLRVFQKLDRIGEVSVTYVDHP